MNSETKSPTSLASRREFLKSATKAVAGAADDIEEESAEPATDGVAA